MHDEGFIDILLSLGQISDSTSVEVLDLTSSDIGCRQIALVTHKVEVALSFAEEFNTALIEDIVQSHLGSWRVVSEAILAQLIIVIYSLLPIARGSSLQKGF